MVKVNFTAKKEINMKLEVGKYYKTRDGRKVKCVHVFEDRKFNNVLFINEKKCEDIIYANRDGYVFLFSEYCANDIISEWVEPVEHELEFLAYRTKEKTLYLTTDRHYWSNPIAKIKVKFTEGEGL